MDTLPFIGLAAFILLIAVLYSSVGHGGASGYLAALSFFTFAAAEMSTTALVLNLLVAGMGTVNFWRSGQLSFRLTLPFLVTSVPAAFLGGALGVPSRTYESILAGVLIFAAVRLLLPDSRRRLAMPMAGPGLPVALLAGAGIGLVSGIVGVGGGIFLSPLMILMGWADPRRTAASSALFILANSASGLVGRAANGHLELGGLLLLALVAFPGGLLGSYIGARWLPSLWLRRLLGAVLLVASTRLVLT